MPLGLSVEGPLPDLAAHTRSPVACSLRAGSAREHLVYEWEVPGGRLAFAKRPHVTILKRPALHNDGPAFWNGFHVND